MPKRMYFIATHNFNKKFEDHKRDHGDSKSDPIEIFELANAAPDLRYAHQATLPRVYAAFIESLKKQTEQGERPQSITIVVDFNLGYSGRNISVMKELIQMIHEEKQFPLSHVKTRAALEKVSNGNTIPVKLALVGSGGSNDYPPNTENLERIDATVANDQYAFETHKNKSYFSVLKEIRDAAKKPAPTPTQPAATTTAAATAAAAAASSTASPSPKPPTPRTSVFAKKRSTFPGPSPSSSPSPSPSPSSSSSPSPSSSSNPGPGPDKERNKVIRALQPLVKSETHHTSANTPAPDPKKPAPLKRRKSF